MNKFIFYFILFERGRDYGDSHEFGVIERCGVILSPSELDQSSAVTGE